MKVVLPVLFTLVIQTVVYGQSTDLPERLVPSDQTTQQANQLNLQAARLLPRFLLKQGIETQSDSESVLGIRGNGAFYSFSTKTHSWNNVPELMLEPSGMLTIVSQSGLMADLGNYPLSDLTAESGIPALKILTSYRPWTTKEEREQEVRTKAELRKSGINVNGSRPAILGHSYVMRAVSPDKADIMVAFRIVKAEKDGSLEIVWKLLNQFIKPSKVYLSDVDLRSAIQKVIDENGIFKTIGFQIKDNKITLNGATTRHEFDLFVRLIEPFRTRGIDAQSVTEIKSP